MAETFPEAAAKIAEPKIEGFHAHVYFRDAHERARGLELRAEAGRRLPRARIGRVHDRPIGPHPTPMFQIAVDRDDFSELVSWLMLERGELSVLVHPLHGDALSEHRDHAAWLGQPLELRLEVFEPGAADESAAPGSA